MLRTLHVRNLAVLADVEVEFGDGLNVLTGETGAGKSIVVDSLALLAGARASTELIRAGADALSVAGVFAPLGAAERRLLEAAGLDAAEDQLVVRREVHREAANRVFVNDQPVTLRLLSELTAGLLRIHTQREELGLLAPEVQRAWLDRSGGGPAAELAERVAAAYRDYRALADRLERVSGDERQRRERVDLLRFQAGEIDAAELTAGEEEELRRERAVLRHAEAIGGALAAAGEPAARGRGRRGGSRGAGPAAARGDRRLAARVCRLARRAGGGAYPARRRSRAPCASGCRGSRPIRGGWTRSRNGWRGSSPCCASTAAAATRPWRCAPGWRPSSPGSTPTPRAARSSRGPSRRRSATTGRRRRSCPSGAPPGAGGWPGGCTGELADLAMAKARFSVRLERQPREASPLRVAGEPVEFSEAGYDRVAFQLAANPGEPAGPLARVASGGELSRVYLALQLAVRGAGEALPATLIFDEVDAGIGGAEAAALGGKLQRLSRGGQILVVTHLPQVASHAARHLRVVKRQAGDRTETGVEALVDDRRVREIARMLAGREVTDLSLSHARELIAVAADEA